MFVQVYTHGAGRLWAGTWTPDWATRQDWATRTSPATQQDHAPQPVQCGQDRLAYRVQPLFSVDLWLKAGEHSALLPLWLRSSVYSVQPLFSGDLWLKRA